MRPECRDALSALCDGEVVDPALVRDALDDPRAAGLLIAVAEVRAALCDEHVEPSAAFDARMERELARLRRAGFQTVLRHLASTPRWVALLGAAAGLVVGLLAGPHVAQRGAAPVARGGQELVASRDGAGRPAQPAASQPGAPPSAGQRAYAFQVGHDWHEEERRP